MVFRSKVSRPPKEAAKAAPEPAPERERTAEACCGTRTASARRDSPYREGFMATDSNTEINIYSIAVRYFEKAQEYICAAKKYDCASIEYDALLSMAIISYYCPFSPHYAVPKNKKLQLSFDNFGCATDDQREFHEKCKEFRNKALAHPDFKYNPTKFDPETKIFSGSQFSILNQGINLETFDDILTRFISVCHKKRAKHSKSVPVKKSE